MNKPDTSTQRHILKSAISAIENECYSLSISGEAMRTVGLTDRAEEIAKKLADSMKLHAFYLGKLEELGPETAP